MQTFDSGGVKYFSLTLQSCFYQGGKGTTELDEKKFKDCSKGICLDIK
jgi:hypothetical protein